MQGRMRSHKGTELESRKLKFPTRGMLINRISGLYKPLNDVNRRFISTMLYLPNVPGRFPVGMTTFVSPVHPSQVVGTAKVKNTRTGERENALTLEEVAFTVYYPADINSTSPNGVPWLLRPLNEICYGLATFINIPSWVNWPFVYLYGAFLKIPAYPNARLLDPSKAKLFPHKQWPLVIFSHGLAGGRNVYSHFCSRLAASGMVVLAIEHRDGTGPVCFPRAWNKPRPRVVHYMKEKDIYWDEGDVFDKHPMPLRAQQLEFRLREVYTTYSTFCRLVRNDPTLKLATIDGSEFDRQGWTALDDDLKVRVDERVTLAGHSFGGCTLLSLLSRNALEGHSPIPVHRSVVLDPWLEPLPTPGPAPLSKPADHVSLSSLQDMPVANPSMLVINSEQFTLWKDHYTRLREVIADWEPQGGRILTLVGSRHPDFSDYAVLPISGSRIGHLILNRISDLVLAFLNDELEDAIAGVPTAELEERVVGVGKDGRPKRKLVGNVGDVIVE